VRIPFSSSRLAARESCRRRILREEQVQYKDFHWRVLETPHFAIHFYDREARWSRTRPASPNVPTTVCRRRSNTNSRPHPGHLYASHSEFQQTNITESFIDAGRAA